MAPPTSVIGGTEQYRAVTTQRSRGTGELTPSFAQPASRSSQSAGASIAEL